MAIKLDASMNTLEHSLDLRLKRQSLLASNLTNLDTPNYKPKDVKFDGFLAERMDGSLDVKNSGEVVEKIEGVVGLDGNGVDLDTEMGKLTDNTLRYNMSLELMRRKLALLRYAATNGRG
jgi:flagellar basal-body rod protein FlgB